MPLLNVIFMDGPYAGRNIRDYPCEIRPKAIVLQDEPPGSQHGYYKLAPRPHSQVFNAWWQPVPKSFPISDFAHCFTMINRKYD